MATKNAGNQHLDHFHTERPPLCQNTRPNYKPCKKRDFDLADGPYFSRDPTLLELNVVCLIVGIKTIPALDCWRWSWGQKTQPAFRSGKNRYFSRTVGHYLSRDRRPINTVTIRPIVRIETSAKPVY